MSDFNPYSQSSLPDNVPLTESAVRFGFFLPAIGIMIVSLLHILTLLLLMSGMLNEGHASRRVSNVDFINAAFYSISIIYAAVLFVGAVGMLWRGSYSWATTTCYLALFPFIGPCFVLAIPFGLWGLTVLGRPGAREALKKS